MAKHVAIDTESCTGLQIGIEWCKDVFEFNAADKTAAVVTKEAIGTRPVGCSRGEGWSYK